MMHFMHHALHVAYLTPLVLLFFFTMVLVSVLRNLQVT